VRIVVLDFNRFVAASVARICCEMIPGAIAKEALGIGHGLNLCDEMQPDVLVLDTFLIARFGNSLIPAIRRSCTQVKILAFTDCCDPLTLSRVAALRFSGYLLKKRTSMEGLIEAITKVAQGIPVFDPDIKKGIEKLRCDSNSLTRLLTNRELQLLSEAGLCLSMPDLARKYGVSVNTVKNQLNSIRRKLDLHSTPSLIRYAIEAGFTRQDTGGKLKPAVLTGDANQLVHEQRIHRSLAQHIRAMVELMRNAPDWKTFGQLLDGAMPRRKTNLPLHFAAAED